MKMYRIQTRKVGECGKVSESKKNNWGSLNETNMKFPFYGYFLRLFLRECIEKPCATRIENEKATSASVEVYFMYREK
jgi:hypothetical protein